MIQGATRIAVPLPLESWALNYSFGEQRILATTVSHQMMNYRARTGRFAPRTDLLLVPTHKVDVILYPLQQQSLVRETSIWGSGSLHIIAGQPAIRSKSIVAWQSESRPFSQLYRSLTCYENNATLRSSEQAGSVVKWKLGAVEIL